MKHLRLSIVFVVLAVLVIPVTASAQSGGLTYTAGIQIQNLDTSTAADRSEERRVGKDSRSRWPPYH